MCGVFGCKNAGGAGSIPGRGAKISHALRPNNQNIKQKQYFNDFNRGFLNGPHLKKKKGVMVGARAGG